MNVASASGIQGWMSLGELRFLAKHASESKLIVEAGCFKGRSTRAMADNTNGVIHAIDPWDGRYEGLGHPRDDAHRILQLDPDGVRKDFYNNLLDYIASGKVIPHTGYFHHFWVKSPNMIFIDANHDYVTIHRDICHALFLLQEGGFLCGHDYRGEWPDVIRAVDEIFGLGIDVEESIWWIKL